jgi:hypothetical protein
MTPSTRIDAIGDRDDAESVGDAVYCRRNPERIVRSGKFTAI